MSKSLLLTLLFNISVLCGMGHKESPILKSITPKCISFCNRTIQRFKTTQLRASKDMSAHFQNQIEKYENVRKKLETKNNQELEKSIKQFVSLSHGNTLLIADMWPDKPTNEELALISKIKN